MNWGDTLCGVEVKPESWDGGVVELRGTVAADGTWEIVFLAGGRVCYGGLSTGPYIAKGCVPIFPPRGWAGKTDAELWDAVFGEMDIMNGGMCVIGDLLSYRPYWQDSWNIGLPWRFTKDEHLPALILALQNAQVLAARLKEKK